LLQQQASQLAVGQQQRVAAARAFVGNPPLIIADEPTSALDADRQSEFLDLLFAQQEQNGTTLLMVTHDRRVAGRFDRVLNLLDICDISGSPAISS
jgi:putative ABC transport system ATP-binding protein